MNTIIQEQDGNMLVFFEGRLDTVAAAETAEACKPLFNCKDQDIIINCTKLDFIASSGLSILVDILKYAKGLEINTWLHEHSASNLPYCIVDDEDCFFINQADHLVKADSKTGITSEVAESIIEILKGEMNKKH